MRILGILAVSLAVLCLPVAMGSQSVFDLGDYGAAHAKKGENGKSDNGKGGGKGGRDKADKSSGKTKQSNSKAARTSSGNGKAGGPKKLLDNIKSAFGGKKAAKVKKTKPVKKQASATKAPKTNGKKAALAAAAASTGAIAGAHPSDMKGLNSLNRNINGMMNSNDPKMASFQEFIRASVESEGANADLVAAQEKLALSQEAYAEYMAAYELSDDPATAAGELDELMAAHLALKPETDDPEDEDLIAWEAEQQRLEDAASALETVEADKVAVDEAQKSYDDVAGGADDEALMQAIVDSINATGAGPVTEEDIPDAMFDKVAAYMGVGDAYGFIDEYAAQMETAEGDSEDDETVDDDEEGEAEETEEDDVAELLITPATE